MNKANECTCPSGDGSLVHPCPAHPAVEQAGGDRWDALQSIMEWTAAKNIPDDRKLCLIRNAARAALAQPSPVRSSLLINGYQLRAALARVAELESKLAELEKQEPVALANRGNQCFWVKWTEAAAGLYGPGIKLYAAPVAQAQRSVPETINEEANSFLRIADAGQFKDNAVAVRTAAVIIRGLLHRPPLMQSIIRHRIGLTPEYEGQWHADLYGEDGEVQHHAEADTPDEAVRAVVALAAAPGNEGV
ncbi:hypothetical protein ACPTJM_28775 [Pseudomonas aeruginosa]|uniref:hypothetical protein n=1 Tax=Pseudomonas aeruginosa TaxID=287 RepID=UPI0037AB83AA